MRFTPESSRGHYIKSFVPGEIHLADRVLRGHAIIAPDHLFTDWQPAPLQELSIADFAPALELKPDIILFGTGLVQQFPDLRLMTEIMRAGTAFEVMQTDAACRTYNVLAGENRAVVAALLVA